MSDNTPITKSDLQEMFAESEKRADNRFTEFTQSLMVALDERFDGVDERFNGVEKELTSVRGELASVREEIGHVRKDMDSGFAVVAKEFERVRDDLDEKGELILEALGTRADKTGVQSQHNTEQIVDHERRIQQLEKFPRMAAA